MAIKVRLTPMGIFDNQGYYDWKTGISLTQGATSEDIESMTDLVNIYRSVVDGTLQVVEGTVADLAALVGNIF